MEKEEKWKLLTHKICFESNWFDMLIEKWIEDKNTQGGNTIRMSYGVFIRNKAYNLRIIEKFQIYTSMASSWHKSILDILIDFFNTSSFLQICNRIKNILLMTGVTKGYYIMHLLPVPCNWHCDII